MWDCGDRTAGSYFSSRWPRKIWSMIRAGRALDLEVVNTRYRSEVYIFMRELSSVLVRQIMGERQRRFALM